MPTLIVLRHAKAESPLGVADIERPLSPRGRRDAAVAGELLRAQGLVPDLVLCSPSVRTRQTLAEMSPTAPVSYEPKIYDNDTDLLLDLLREQHDEPGTLLLIGHNPALHQLVADLAEEPEKGFPTAAIAAIDFDGLWLDLTSGTLTYSAVARA